MAGIGEASAIIAVAHLGIGLSNTLIAYVGEVRDAPSRIDRIGNEVLTTSERLKDIGDLVEQNPQAGVLSEEGVLSAVRCSEECHKVLTELTSVLSKSGWSQPLNGEENLKINTSLFSTLWWPFLKVKLEVPRAELQRIKIDLTLLFSSAMALRASSTVSKAKFQHDIPGLSRSRDLAMRMAEQAKKRAQNRERDARGKTSDDNEQWLKGAESEVVQAFIDFQERRIQEEEDERLSERAELLLKQKEREREKAEKERLILEREILERNKKEQDTLLGLKAKKSEGLRNELRRAGLEGYQIDTILESSNLGYEEAINQAAMPADRPTAGSRVASEENASMKSQFNINDGGVVPKTRTTLVKWFFRFPWRRSRQPTLEVLPSNPGYRSLSRGTSSRPVSSSGAPSHIELQAWLVDISSHEFVLQWQSDEWIPTAEWTDVLKKGVGWKQFARLDAFRRTAILQYLRTKIHREGKAWGLLSIQTPYKPFRGGLLGNRNSDPLIHLVLFHQDKLVGDGDVTNHSTQPAVINGVPSRRSEHRRLVPHTTQREGKEKSHSLDHRAAHPRAQSFDDYHHYGPTYGTDTRRQSYWSPPDIRIEKEELKQKVNEVRRERPTKRESMERDRLELKRLERERLEMEMERERERQERDRLDRLDRERFNRDSIDRDLTDRDHYDQDGHVRERYGSRSYERRRDDLSLYGDRREERGRPKNIHGQSTGITDINDNEGERRFNSSRSQQQQLAIGQADRERSRTETLNEDDFCEVPAEIIGSVSSGEEPERRRSRRKESNIEFPSRSHTRDMAGNEERARRTARQFPGPSVSKGSSALVLRSVGSSRVKDYLQGHVLDKSIRGRGDDIYSNVPSRRSHLGKSSRSSYARGDSLREYGPVPSRGQSTPTAHEDSQEEQPVNTPDIGKELLTQPDITDEEIIARTMQRLTTFRPDQAPITSLVIPSDLALVAPPGASTGAGRKDPAATDQSLSQATQARSRQASYNTPSAGFELRMRGDSRASSAGHVTLDGVSTAIGLGQENIVDEPSVMTDEDRVPGLKSSRTTKRQARFADEADTIESKEAGPSDAWQNLPLVPNGSSSSNHQRPRSEDRGTNEDFVSGRERGNLSSDNIETANVTPVVYGSSLPDPAGQRRASHGVSPSRRTPTSRSATVEELQPDEDCEGYID